MADKARQLEAAADEIVHTLFPSMDNTMYLRHVAKVKEILRPHLEPAAQSSGRLLPSRGGLPDTAQGCVVSPSTSAPSPAAQPKGEPQPCNDCQPDFTCHRHMAPSETARAWLRSREVEQMRWKWSDPSSMMSREDQTVALLEAYAQSRSPLVQGMGREGAANTSWEFLQPFMGPTGGWLVSPKKLHDALTELLQSRPSPDSQIAEEALRQLNILDIAKNVNSFMFRTSAREIIKDALAAIEKQRRGE